MMYNISLLCSEYIDSNNTVRPMVWDLLVTDMESTQRVYDDACDQVFQWL